MMLENKVAIVTGGCSGIGAAIVQTFLHHGAKVAVFDLTSNTEKEDTNLFYYKGNVTNTEHLENFYEAVLTKFGKIDIVVANAGILYGEDLHKVTEARFDKVIDTNIKGVFFTVQKSLNFLNRGSSVILMASTMAHCAMENQSVYALSKAAVIQMTKNFAVDLSEKEIRVNSISPSFIDTNLLKVVKIFVPNVIEKLSEDVPLGKRLAKPEEIADLALFLVSEHAYYITGEDFKIDGGVTNRRKFVSIEE